METNPTLFYSLMRMGGLSYCLPRKDWNPKADILLAKCATAFADPRRLAGAKPILMENSLWSNNTGYVRPYCESIYKTSLPKKFEEFHTLPATGYPPIFPFTNEYFFKTMKEKFGVDITKPDQKVHDALVEAWDFFKEESKELDK